MNDAQKASLARTVLKIMGGYAIAKGYLSAEHTLEISGFFAAFVGGLWSHVSHK